MHPAADTVGRVKVDNLARPRPFIPDFTILSIHLLPSRFRVGMSVLKAIDEILRNFACLLQIPIRLILLNRSCCRRTNFPIDLADIVPNPCKIVLDDLYIRLAIFCLRKRRNCQE